ncbi:IclR family transcriptional regulator [Paenibacillus cisolokensis]|jgi:DNA-binding IclR family transcriptional regulator|uniref:IclR family transcriptional regulator n=1 Tax=Paenibacillus cisolokensis TaxID=1658519 RepID=A0ABQ4NCS3_9BACL|nr:MULTISPECIES: IclR family transcriptional regulator [Paenibacillus]ALS30047.1 IclR family transcriptional regulator [Paenibacillus sp. 32O-W]GIQ66028.1 IclR family transcriptional regulator [Paenibacillus cisolokensis]
MEEGKSTVRAVERALDILLCFTTDNEWGMAEIAERVGLHKSTVHRMLATLENRGFVERDRVTDRYRLGIKIWELSAMLSRSDDPAVIWLPEMERLRDLLGETVSLYVRDGMERIRIQAVQSNQAVRRVAPVGARLPLYVGASSKVLNAYADPAELEAIMSADSWPASIDRNQYLQQLADIREAGYATSVEEREAGVAAVSAPIFDRTGKLVAALSVSGPASRLTMEKMREHAPLIMETAGRMGTMTL